MGLKAAPFWVAMGSILGGGGGFIYNLVALKSRWRIPYSSLPPIHTKQSFVCLLSSYWRGKWRIYRGSIIWYVYSLGWASFGHQLNFIAIL